MQYYKKIRIFFVLLETVLIAAVPAYAARIKDIAEIKGVRENQLIGYGLVVGLDQTGDGDKTVFTKLALAGMMRNMGLDVSPDEFKVKNTAAVIVTADLPPFAKAGAHIDVLVSSLGDAKNLQGGTLILTPLKGLDGNVYAIAQGPVSTGGFSAGGEAAQVQKNFPTVGRVPGGAMIEREIPYDFSQKKELTLALDHPDFTTAVRAVERINAVLSEPAAAATDPGTIHIRLPKSYEGNIVRFAMEIENIQITPDAAARIVINERTGTIVMGENVRISKVAVAHGNLNIQVSEGALFSQPPPLSEGGTGMAVPDTAISYIEGDNRLILMQPGTTIGELVKALNALGVTPRDLIAILQAIKAAGALHAKLEII
ncbi:MAG: flagellar basal body P-ring protein FlgI [Desulfococcaceae bacterium]|jgi:flagellar P-ring protein precursor FlgI|nr:flagellar basal body P-ring protein FlgI [Desulfococcaceae bacterium]